MKNYIDEFLNYLTLKGKAKSTIKNYRLYLGEFDEFASYKVTGITLDLIDKFQAKLAISKSLTTQSYYLITIRSFLKYLRIRKNLDVLDPLKIELPKIRRKIQDALSKEETKRLLAAAPLQDRYDIRARAIIEFLLGSGVRVAELCSIKVNDIDLKERWFRVIGKGNKQRVCFLNDGMVRTLKKYLETRVNNNANLFTQYSARFATPLTPRSVERTVKKYALKAGIIKQVTPHTLRRTFATQLLRKNVDIRYIQEFLGHDSLQTTQWYTKIEQNQLEKIYRLANKKTTKNVKEDEKILIGRESFAKLTGMVGKAVEQQQRIIRKLKKEEQIDLQRTITVN